MASVMVVDDEKSIRMTMGVFFRAAGYDVAVAEDALVACDLMLTRPFDVIVSDIVLPRMSGLDLLQKVRTSFPETRVILMTGDPSEDTEAKALQGGAFDYLVKPIEKDALMRAVANGVRARGLEVEGARQVGAAACRIPVEPGRPGCYKAAVEEITMATTNNDPNEIRTSDIVFDCPFCQKSLAIDCRGAGLTITCPDCDNRVQVPIPEGMDVTDIDSTDEDREVRIIHMREVLASSQNRIVELETELEDLTQRRESLEKLRAENAVRFDVIGREIEVIQRSLVRIAEVLESAADSSRKTAASAGS